VAGAAAGNMKYVTMELGGKSACIILPDADIEQAVDGAMMANFFSTGQVCTNGTRVFVPERIKPDFEKCLLRKMQYVRPGDVMDPATNFGPLVSQVHWGKVQKYIRHGIEVDKATLLCGGPGMPAWLNSYAGPDAESYKKGFWVQPTVFTNCTDDMTIVREEIFGPVMSILSYKTVDEVVARANDTPLGLAAGVFTRDLNLAHQVIGRLEAGITWVNTWGESPAEMAVGGWKMSGVGVENGKKGLDAWVRNKSTLVEMEGEVPTVFAKL
jgi:betaine-aldehyde dehydrogenase